MNHIYVAFSKYNAFDLWNAKSSHKFKKRHQNPKLHPLIQIVIFLFFLFSGILVTGYSLGAGISQLVAMDLLQERPNVRCISYGAPLIFAPDIDNPEPDNDAGQHLYTVVCNLQIRNSHSMFLDWWNTAKSLSNIWQFFIFSILKILGFMSFDVNFLKRVGRNSKKYFTRTSMRS